VGVDAHDDDERHLEDICAGSAVEHQHVAIRLDLRLEHPRSSKARTSSGPAQRHVFFVREHGRTRWLADAQKTRESVLVDA
jgi:hypothetical protein